ncbi:transcriptional regulator [Streptomyces spiroverticillatus]|uniref:Transcriptional regulator n=1 Tax=Streptomyces finlayi TaxID=67296 RepID=A0A918WZU0_9ACTN|nr:helix-turn-helix domain-containing protein [Streptomyces finlayi]GHA17391.1 transcriptional regulator [Streptomyces spiroverticillatus]GHC99316.1 transcriptional regulator [Streptomyces finlayi]
MDAMALGDLIDVVRSPALRLLAVPRDAAVKIGDVLLYDAHAPLPHTPGALLLAVGVRAAEAGPLVREAAAAGLAGVLVRGTEDAPVAEAETYGMALLSVEEGAAWHHVHLTLASAIEARPAQSDSLADLFALAGAIATATGGATSLEDPHQRILAYSTVPGQPVDEDRRQGILGLQVPDGLGNSAQYRTVFAAPGPVRLPPIADGDLPRLAVAVRAGDEPLGSIWVVDSGSLAPDAEKTLTQGASTAALLLLRARAAQELARHRNTDLLRRLLDGTADPAAAARQLGAGPVRVAAFALEDTGNAPDSEWTSLRLLDVVRLQCEARSGRHACVLVDGVVYALLGASGDAAQHRQLAENIVRRAGRALRVPVRAALGGVVPDPGAVPDSRADADLVLRLLHDGLPVATVDELRARVTLLGLAAAMREDERLQVGVRQRIVAADADQGTEYARTLAAWLDAGCDVARASKELSVHPNTCRYRLKQAGRQFGIDLQDPDERLVLWLHLRTLGG